MKKIGDIFGKNGSRFPAGGGINGKGDLILDFKIFFDGSRDGMLVAEKESMSFIVGNKAICQMLGYSEKEIKKLGVKDIHPEKDLPFVISKFNDLMQNKITVALDLPVKRKDGSVFYVDIAASPIVVGKKEYLLGNFRDAAERRKIEAEILFKNAMLETQQETTIDGILVVDENGKMISFNRRFIEIWGIPGDVIASRSDERALQSVLDKLVKPEEFLARVKYLYEHKDEKSREEILLKGGTVLDRFSAPMFGGNGDKKYYGRVWYFRDITQSKKDAEILKEKVSELEKMNKLMVGRELKMVELKEELAALKKRLQT